MMCERELGSMKVGEMCVSVHGNVKVLDVVTVVDRVDYSTSTSHLFPTYEMFVSIRYILLKIALVT
jgi:hypothetical protein